MSALYSCFALSCFFFFNDTATTEIYTLSLHDALPIYTGPGNMIIDALVYHFSHRRETFDRNGERAARGHVDESVLAWCMSDRSEEHTSELQSQSNLVCRLLLEKKKQKHAYPPEIARLS